MFTYFQSKTRKAMNNRLNFQENISVEVPHELFRSCYPKVCTKQKKTFIVLAKSNSGAMIHDTSTRIKNASFSVTEKHINDGLQKSRIFMFLLFQAVHLKLKPCYHLNQWCHHLSFNLEQSQINVSFVVDKSNNFSILSITLHNIVILNMYRCRCALLVDSRT